MTAGRGNRHPIRRWLWAILAVAVLGGYWLLPLSGRVVVMKDSGAVGLWPALQISEESLLAGDLTTVTVSDSVPWSFVSLRANGIQALQQGDAVERAGTWSWTWTYEVPADRGYVLTFYRDCHAGCVERGQWAIGEPAAPGHVGLPTKLGLMMPSLNRDWHSRSGWAVEVTYARRAEDDYWGVDDLAERIAAHRDKGLHILVRVDFDQKQTLPRPGNYIELTEYLGYLRRLARDARMRDVYGYIIGSDINAAEAMASAGEDALTPQWYARVFGGYGEDVVDTFNAVQVIREENPFVRVIVGPLRPWVEDPGGTRTDLAPWLSYMDDLVRCLDEAASAKGRFGVPMAGPDGFDLQAPGRPDAPEMGDVRQADEPRTDLRSDQWGGARIGFRVYKDWLAIINTYPTTRGLPAYIISTNTYDREAGIPPAQNYPSGWLGAALDVVNDEPQIAALVWFLDEFPHSDEWDWFSLTEQSGRLADAAREFDTLLRLE